MTGASQAPPLPPSSTLFVGGRLVHDVAVLVRYADPEVSTFEVASEVPRRELRMALRRLLIGKGQALRVKDTHAIDNVKMIPGHCPRPFRLNTAGISRFRCSSKKGARLRGRGRTLRESLGTAWKVSGASLQNILSFGVSTLRGTTGPSPSGPRGPREPGLEVALPSGSLFV